MIKWITGLVDKKLLKFIIVGCINTVVGSCIMFGLYNLAGCSYWVSSVANYVLTSILSFFLNKYFTFQNKERSWKQVVRFVVNIAVCYLLAYGIAKPAVSAVLAGAGQKIQENAAMFTGMVLFTGFNYLGQRLFAFAEPGKNK
ncbi:MAG: GtrA family protein [Coprococcus sp.]